MNPLISVLLLTHNAGNYLALAIDSILNQTYPHLELVLVDNGSTDSSVQNALRTRTDPRIRLFRLPQNLFQSGGLNVGMPHCKGDFVAIMDADDISLPQRLERQLTAFKDDPTLAGIGCAAMTLNPEGAVTGREFTLTAPGDVHIYSQYDMPFNFPTLMARRELFAAFPFRTGLLSPDLDLLARARATHKFLGLSEVLFHYRRHPASVTTSNRAAIFACASVARMAHARREANQPEEFEKLIAEKDHLLTDDPPKGVVFAYYARRALGEGHYRQAIWHARRSALFGSRIEALALLCRILAASRRRPLVEQRFLWRLAMLGTIKAYRLHPA